MKWPWQRAPRVINASPKRWPKKVYFLDGPLKGETHESLPCSEILLLANRGPLESVWDGLAYLNILRPTPYVEIRYRWDTFYANGNVAFARLSPPRLTA